MHIAAQQGLHAALGAAERFLNSLKGFLQKALCQRASELSPFRESAEVAGRPPMSPRCWERREVVGRALGGRRGRRERAVKSTMSPRCWERREVAGRPPMSPRSPGAPGGRQDRRESAKVLGAPGCRRERREAAGSAAGRPPMSPRCWERREVARVAASAGRTASGNGNADANENAAEAKQKPRRGHPQQGLLSFVLLLYD